MEQLILAISPVVATLLTQGSKRLLEKFTLVGADHPLRNVILRFVLAVLAYVSVLVGAAYSGRNELDPVSVDTFAKAIIEFLATTGLFFFARK